jgi:D-3-phosphoglycerate dehydrogenase
MERPKLLVLVALPATIRQALEAVYTLRQMTVAPSGQGWVQGDWRGVRAVITNGSTGLTAAQISELPDLELVCAFGAGYENVDIVAAAARSVAVTHAPGANAETVADHALGFMLALARGYPLLDRAVRRGQWNESRASRPTLSGSTLGILGLGRIGMLVAQRAAAFGMTIGYCNRSPRDGVAWTFHRTPRELASASEFLVACCPGGAATRHVVNAEVLAALGPKGLLVNISRGSIVDTAALIDALRNGTIAGAGLDVVEGEPDLPAPLLQLDNVLLTPHMAGRSPAAFRAQRDVLLASLGAHFAGAPVPNRVPSIHG